MTVLMEIVHRQLGHETLSNSVLKRQCLCFKLSSTFNSNFLLIYTLGGSISEARDRYDPGRTSRKSKLHFFFFPKKSWRLFYLVEIANLKVSSSKSACLHAWNKEQLRLVYGKKQLKLSLRCRGSFAQEEPLARCHKIISQSRRAARI